MSKIVSAGSSGDLFDLRPIELPGFRLTARSAVAVGKPSAEQFQHVLAFATAAHQASPYWIGDLMAYAESRQDWAEKRDQVVAVTGLAEKTIANLTYVSTHVEAHEREIAPSMGHAAEVAALPRPQQTKYLHKAKDEGWTTRELRQHIRAERRTRVIDGQAVLRGKYRVIYADPPWSYTNHTPLEDGSLRRAEEAYPSMSIADLCRLPVEAHALPDAVLWLWATTPLLLQNPGPREVLEAWGFAYKTNYTWDKVLGMPGSYSYVTHETLIVATRGSGTPDIPITQHDHDSVIVERRSGQHSEKPELFRKLIQQLYPRGPYLELFGRKKVQGWTVFGNDARLWQREAGA
jgi:N6-adenosine-specific RNA methylase IME4